MKQEVEPKLPMVFAVPVLDEAGRKLVDYYMTWKGKTVSLHSTLVCSPNLTDPCSWQRVKDVKGDGFHA